MHFDRQFTVTAELKLLIYSNLLLFAGDFIFVDIIIRPRGKLYIT